MHAEMTAATDVISVNAFFTLLRAGLWERESLVLSLPLLSAKNWDEIYELAKQQTVRGLVYRGICMLPENRMPDDARLMRWVVAADDIERRNRLTNNALSNLCQWFESRGVTPAVLKGQGVALFYENPLLRECGDIDLYFPSVADRQKARELLDANGVKITDHADGSFSYVWKGVEVEHHTKAVDLHRRSLKPILDELISDSGFTAISLDDMAHKAKVLVPSPTLNLVMLNAHILKHALGTGVGLRQLCDMARAYSKLHDTVNRNQLKLVIDVAGIKRFTTLLNTFLIEHLGLPASSLPFTGEIVSAEPLMARVMSGGNFGHYNPTRRSAMSSVFKRKLHTAGSFVRNIGFARRYAPVEAAGIFMRLLKGQASC